MVHVIIADLHIPIDLNPLVDTLFSAPPAESSDILVVGQIGETVSNLLWSAQFQALQYSLLQLRQFRAICPELNAQ